MTERPIGVTILAILSGLLGIGVLGTGLGLLAIVSGNVLKVPLLTFFASIFIVFGALGLAIAYGMWKGLAWGRWLAIMAIGLRIYQLVIALLLVLSSGILVLTSEMLFPVPFLMVVGMGLAVIAVDLLILTYLVRPSIEDFFHNHESRLSYLTMLLFPVPFVSLCWAVLLSIDNGISLYGIQSVIFVLITLISGTILLAAPRFFPEQ